MRVALVTNFAASRKEPLAAMLGRVHQAFLDSGLGEPVIRFNFGDAPLAGFVSSVDRVLKRYPDLKRFVTSAEPMPGIHGARRISNGPMSEASGESVPYATLEAIAAGVPRSFPFHSVVFHLHSPEFGQVVPTIVRSAEMMCGVLITDSWWVNGRNRSLSACYLVDAEENSKKLPLPAGPLAAVLAACGKAKTTVQAPLSAEMPTAPSPAVRLPNGTVIPSANPQAVLAVKPIVDDYRARMAQIVEKAALPHDLPSQIEAAQSAFGVATGPKKPALDAVFKPLGYSCKGGSGSFDLRRRTEKNLTVELHLDVGTWGGSMIGIYKVMGVGFKATLMPPVTAGAVQHAQYPVGDADHWRKIVENLGALVAELDRTFVPDIEAAVGPSPEWYQPET